MHAGTAMESQTAIAKEIRLEPGLSAGEIDTKLRRVLRESDIGHRQLAYYLADMEERGLFQLLGCSSAVHYATSRLDLGRRTARELVAIGRELCALRKIDEAFARGDVSWSRVRLLVKIAVPGSEEAWLARAAASTWERFQREVMASEKGRLPRKDRKGLPEIRLQVPLQLDPLSHEICEQARRKLSAEAGEPVDHGQAYAAMARLFLVSRPGGSLEGRSREVESCFKISFNWCLECDAPEVLTEDGPAPFEAQFAGSILPEADVTVVRSSADPASPVPDRTTPAWMRDEVLARDGHACLNCRARRRLMVHHIVWRSRGGTTTPSNLGVTCVTCHAMIHAGLIEVAGEAPHRLTWTTKETGSSRLGAAPAQPVLILPNAMAQSTPLVATEPAASGLPPGIAALPSELAAAEWREIRARLVWNERRGIHVQDPGASVPTAIADPPPLKPPTAHRSSSLDRVIGQARTVETLSRAVRAARRTGGTMAHTLLLGGPGLGKSTLAQAVAMDLGTRLHATSGPQLKDRGALIDLLAQLRQGDVIFLDELHALPLALAEALYEAMEDFRLRLPVTDGVTTRTITVALEPFNLVGATSEAALLPKPLIMRFRLREMLDWYGVDDLTAIVQRTATASGLAVDPQAARVIARAGRDTPREALGLLERVRIWALSDDRRVIDASYARSVLATQGIDEEGLDPLDRRILSLLWERGPSRPLGLARLATLAGTTPEILASLHEPFLVRRGLLVVTPHGRISPGPRNHASGKDRSRTSPRILPAGGGT